VELSRLINEGLDWVVKLDFGSRWVTPMVHTLPGTRQVSQCLRSAVNPIVLQKG
jgi:hypothetical protein